jgi:hypothetical protein
LDSITQTKFQSLAQNPDNLNEHILTLNSNTQLSIDTKSLRWDVRYDGKTVISANSKGLFYFEHLRNKEDPTNDIPGINMNNAWEESFGGEHDVRPNGVTLCI